MISKIRLRAGNIGTRLFMIDQIVAEISKNFFLSNLYYQVSVYEYGWRIIHFEVATIMPNATAQINLKKLETTGTII